MACQLAGHLASRGYQVELISWDMPGASAFYEVHPNVRWHQLGYAPGVLDKARRALALTKVLRARRVRVLIGFVMSRDRTVYAGALLAGARIVVAERNAPAMYWHSYTRLQRYEAFALMRAACRIAVQLPSFLDMYPASLRGRMVCIPNPVPSPSRMARPQLPNAHQRYEVLAVSRLDARQKRIQVLIRAFALVSERFPLWDLRIIGDGPEREALERQVDQLALKARVLLEPARTDIYSSYSKAHLFATTSLWEGFSNSLAEAMSHGLPAVGYRGAAGVADLINHGGGWLADGIDDVNTFASALGEAMLDAEGREKRGRLASRGMSRFNDKEIQAAWEHLLAGVA